MFKCIFIFSEHGEKSIHFVNFCGVVHNAGYLRFKEIQDFLTIVKKYKTG